MAASVLGIRALMVQKHKVHELSKGSRTAWSPLPSLERGIPGKTGACVSRPEFSFKKMEVGRERQRKASSLWTSPESSSE